MKRIEITREPGVYCVKAIDDNDRCIREAAAYNTAMAHDVARILAERTGICLVVWLTD